MLKNILTLLFMVMLIVALSSCRRGRSITPQKQPEVAKTAGRVPEATPKRDYRPQISAKRNRYEGTLWRDESSFGNLWRDHRARFRNDLLTIIEVNKVTNIPPKKKQEEKPSAPTGVLEKANLALEALTLRDTIEEEQNDILRSLDTISAEVIRVLPNGNMVIRGKKVDHRQRNQVRYLTTVVGILRPADVTGNNVVSATKLADPEVKIKRQVQGSLIRERIDKLQPLLGKQKAGFLGRVTDFTKADK